MPGNRIGPRGRYDYESDDGTTYVIRTDADLATAGGLVANTTGGTPKPTGFQPRGVYAQASDGARRFIVCNLDSTIYDTSSSTTVTIDGESFTTTGRRGEKLTF